MTLFNIFVFLMYAVCHTNAVMTRRYRSNLVLYSGYTTDHGRAYYSNSEPNDWKNLTKLAHEAGLQEKALLCGVGGGAWIAYPLPDYQTDDEYPDTKIIIGDACISADHIESVQPVGPTNKLFRGLLTFTAANFGTEPLYLNNETTVADGVGSIISSPFHVGEWYIEGNGRKFCLQRPRGLIKAGVCVLPDLATELGIKDATVTVGCDGADGGMGLSNSTIFIQLQSCFSKFGAFRIRANYLQLPIISSICNGEGRKASKLGFQMIIDSWKFRLSKSRQQETNPADIDTQRDDPLTPMRMDMLTNFFEIFKLGCNALVSDEYFNLVRYMYMQHLKFIWKEAPQVVEDRRDTMKMWQFSQDYMKNCLATRKANPARVGDGTSLIPCRRTSPFEGPKPSWESNVLDLFLEGEELDPVIEQVWIMLNYVAPYCAGVSAVQDNVWAEFVAFFRRQFLLPLIQQWLYPGTWKVYYEYMFNGIPLEKGKRQVISCTRDLLRTTPLGDPVDRPSAMVKDFLSLSRRRTNETADHEATQSRSSSAAQPPVSSDADATATPPPETPESATEVPDPTTTNISRRKRGHGKHP